MWSSYSCCKWYNTAEQTGATTNIVDDMSKINTIQRPNRKNISCTHKKKKKRKTEQ